jgi:hypothetical protein
MVIDKLSFPLDPMVTLDYYSESLPIKKGFNIDNDIKCIFLGIKIGVLA